MQYMLNNGPYRHESAATSTAHPLRWMVRQYAANGYAIALKLILITCVLFGFYQLVVYLLTWSDSSFVQLVALAAWSCGAIPLIYRLWRLDLAQAYK